MLYTRPKKKNEVRTGPPRAMDERMMAAVSGRRQRKRCAVMFVSVRQHLALFKFFWVLAGGSGGGVVGWAWEHRMTTTITTTATTRVDAAARRFRTTQQRTAVGMSVVEAAEVAFVVGGTDGCDDPSVTTLPLLFEESPLSAFGTKEYWDDMYQGRGDFSSEQYSWYYNWGGTLQKHVKPYLKSTKNDKMLLPGIGNDPLLLDLLTSGYTNLVAQDYSTHALDRQRELLSPYYTDAELKGRVQLIAGDVRVLPPEWRHNFDVVMEKGLLDAVYLSGDGNVELAVTSLGTTLRPGGYFVSVSGVVPELLRRQVFPTIEWRWIRDGSHDLQAGCFIFQKR